MSESPRSGCAPAVSAGAWGRGLCLVVGAMLCAAVGSAAEVDLIVTFNSPVSAESSLGKSTGFEVRRKSLAARAPSAATWLTGQKVVAMDPIAGSLSDARAMKRDAGSAESQSFRVLLDTVKPPAEVIRDLSTVTGVAHVEINQRGRLTYTPTDGLYQSQQSVDFANINLENGWDAQVTPGGRSDVRVAIIDSGCEAIHEDLLGAIDLADSRNVADGNSTTITDDRGHGTRIAGIIGARAGNGNTIAGIAFHSTLLIYDVQKPDGVITLSDVVSAVSEAHAAHADVINMSLAFDAYSLTLKQVCDAAEADGILIVAAAGNEGRGDHKIYPASYDSVMGVGALDDSGEQRAEFSNYNGTAGDLAEIFAPGKTIFSSIPGSQYNGTFGSGTSFAAPMVAGAAALLKSEHPEQSGRAIRDHLRRYAAPLPQFTPAGGQGAGKLDVGAALSNAMKSSLRIEKVVVDDAKSHRAANDADGVLDSGEVAYLTLTLTSDQADAESVTGTVSTASPAIASIDGATSLFGDVVHAQSKVNVVPFGPVTVATSTTQDIAFQLGFNGDGGSTQTLTFLLALEDEENLPGVPISNATLGPNKTYHVTNDLRLRNNVTIGPDTTFKIDAGKRVLVENNCVLTALGTAEDPITFTSYVPAQGLSSIPPFGRQNSIGPRTEPTGSGYTFELYVAKNGSDSNSGDRDHPFQSLAYAFTHLPQGTTADSYAVFVAEGTYIGGGDQLNQPGQTFVFGGFESATWTRDIYKHRTIVDGEGLRGTIKTETPNSAQFDGFVIMGGAGWGIRSEIVAQHGYTLSNCFIIGNNATNGGGLITGINGGFQVTNNYIVRNCLFMNNSATADGGAIYTGPKTLTTITNSIFINNTAGANYSACRFAGPTIFENNLVFGHAGIAIGCTGTAAVTIRNNVFYDNPGTVIKVASSASTATKIYNNTFNANGAGIEALQASSIVNNILWGNTGTELSAAGGTITNNLVEGGFAGDPNVVITDPVFAGTTGYGLIESATYNASSRTSTAVLTSNSLHPTVTVMNVLQIGADKYPICPTTDAQLTFFGDITKGGTRVFPAQWSISSLRIQAGSGAIGNGRGVTADASVPPLDIDGSSRGSSLVTDIGADLYLTADTKPFRWGTFEILSSATSANLSHLIVENGSGVRVDLQNVSVSDSVFQNNLRGGFTVLNNHSFPIVNCVALNNFGDGFNAPSCDVTGSRGSFNAGNGIVGDTVDSAVTEENGLTGVSADFATSSTSHLNAGAGFTVLSGGARLVGTENTIGIVVTGAGNLIDSAAYSNTGDGVSITGGGSAVGIITKQNGGDGLASNGSIADSLSQDNVGFGARGSGTSSLLNCRIIGNLGGAVNGIETLTNCAVTDNGAGLTNVASMAGCYIGANTGVGVQAAQISDSAILGNSAGGVAGFTTLNNSWVVGNHGVGVNGVSGLGAITNSSVLRNNDVGTRNVLSGSSSNIWGNNSSPVQAEDTVVQSIGATPDRQFAGTFWGDATSTETLTPPQNGDYTFIKDTLDIPTASGSYIIAIEPVAFAPVANAPDQAPPAFVLSVTPNTDDVVTVGLADFVVTFSKPMNTLINPAVTFHRNAPYTGHVVEPAPGWENGTTWHGMFAIQSDTGDGLNTIRISNAYDATGFLIPDDISHQFEVDSDPPGSAGNGQATATGSDTIQLSWEPPSSLTEYPGFNIQRSESAAGPFVRINAASISVTHQAVINARPQVYYDDTGLQASTHYYYQVFAVNELENATQWTDPLDDTTFPATSVKAWNLY